MSEDLKIGILGSGGRMGRMLIAQVHASEGCRIAGATEASGHETLGQDIGELVLGRKVGVAVTSDTYAMMKGVDVVIDFTVPAATATHANIAADAGCAMVIGTTGLNENQESAVQEAAGTVAIVRAPNMSVGVTLLMALTEQVAGILGEEYDIEIVEMHHRHKIDAPSGTAVGLGEAAARGREVDIQKVRQAVRDGHTGPRRKGDIGFATLRGGDVVGDHTVIFAGTGERIELGHKAQSREVFAAGAVRAALWTRDRAPGIYSMRDVLGLKV